MSGLLYLHLGLPKTASSWLQARVFPRLEHLAFVPTPRTRLLAEAADRAAEGRVMACALRRGPRLWREMGPALLEEATRGAPPEPGVLVSDEAIGRAASRPEMLAAHLVEIARVARDRGFAGLRAIGLIRRQDSWLASHYAQLSDRNARASQRDFEGFVARVTDPARSRFGFGTLLDFDALREALCGAGIELRLMPHERLRLEPRAALETILAWLDAPSGAVRPIADAALGTAENARSEGGTWRLRPRSWPLPGGRRLRLPALAPRGRITLTPALSARILASYAPSNRALERAHPMGLGPLGYFGDVPV